VEKLIPSDVQKAYDLATQRIFLIDFEGTLVDRSQSSFDTDVDDTLSTLADDTRNSIVVLSDRTAMDLNCLTDPRITIAAESGGFMRSSRGWQTLGDFYLLWKDSVSTALRRLAQRYPDTTIEEKHFSVTWDYGRGVAHLPEADKRQLKAAFRMMSSQYNVPMIETEHSVEFKAAEISKGKFVASWMNLHGPCDFILAIGDDKSDEDVFNLIDRKYISVRVGYDSSSHARYYLQSRTEVLPLLKGLAAKGKATLIDI
jgi:trehalose 6-phosphate synthase/phosphatase